MTGLPQMPEHSEKIAEVIDRLLEKTQRGEITWSDDVEDASFIASFPNYSVSLAKASKGDQVILTIFNDQGRQVSEFEQPFRAYSDSLSDPLQREAFKIGKLYDLVSQSHQENALDGLLRDLRQVS